MKIEMIMPQMGESIVEGTIVKWRKRVGEPVEKDEMILDISTDKVDSEIPSPASGILAEILAEEGKTVAVKTPIARIAVDEKMPVNSSRSVEGQTTSDTGKNRLVAPASIGEGVDLEPAVEQSVKGLELQDSSRGTLDTAPSQTGAAAARSDSKRFLSPVVKKIAREYGLAVAELEQIQGRGANQRITKQDILNYLSRKTSAKTAALPAAAPLPAEIPLPRAEQTITSPALDEEIIAMDHVRKRIAEHMIISKRTSAHVTSVAEVDVTPIVQYREQVKKSFEAREGFPLTYTAFFIDATARALKEFPLINASLDGDKIIIKRSIHIGIAVGLEDKLIVPVIRNTDRLNLSGLARALHDLASRARNRQLKPEEVQGGTFSITNIGTFGNLWGTPIINQPQVAILGTGAIKKRPVVINDGIAIRSMMYLSLTYDHRLIDGLYGGKFLQRIVQLLETYKLD